MFADAGFLLSLYTGYRIAQRDASRPSRGARGICPVGRVDPLVVCGRGLDRVPADANARHVAGRRLSMSQFRAKCGWRVPCRWAALALSIGVILAGCRRSRPSPTAAPCGCHRRRDPIASRPSPRPIRSVPAQSRSTCWSQDATTGDALPDANVRLSLAPRDEPDEARLYVSAQWGHDQQTVSLGHVPTADGRASGRSRLTSKDRQGPRGRRSTSRRATGCRAGSASGPGSVGRFWSSRCSPSTKRWSARHRPTARRSFDEQFLATRRRRR